MTEGNDSRNRPGTISENSTRVAKNTMMLYFRMLLLMFIGLFTSRVILKTLGVDDYDVYGTVGSIVTAFTVVTAAISQAISRYITFELGKGDQEKLRKIFSTSVIIQILFCLVILLLTETVGIWYLNHRVVLPEGRLDAARWVLQCSMGILMVTLLSVPFNAVITAHEKMKAYAYISILEGVLKLGVALLLYVSPVDKLKTYAVLMLCTSIMIRATYSAYCRRHFIETRGRLVFDRKLLKEMTGFAGWSFLGSGAIVVNTQGVNLLSNSFFGVGVNAARSVAAQVENIVKQFVTNFLIAVNPQITKSYARQDYEYCHEVTFKGIKFSFLVMLLFQIPVVFEAPLLLHLWLDEVPPMAVTFVRLTVFSLMADMMFNPLLTFIQATGRIKKYYIISSSVAIFVFFLSWLAFACGAPAYVSYIIFASVYLIIDGIKLLTVHFQSAYPVRRLLTSVVCPLLAVTALSFGITYAVWCFLPEGLVRLFAVLVVGTACIAGFTWLLALTPGEKQFVIQQIKSKICR